MRDDLNEILQDIGSFALKDDFTPFPHLPKWRPKKGPSDWDKVTKADYSLTYDYVILRRGRNTVIEPFSKAAKYWLDWDRPESSDRYGSCGYIVESHEINDVLERMAQVDLMSEDDFLFNQLVEERLQHGMANDAEQGR